MMGSIARTARSLLLALAAVTLAEPAPAGVLDFLFGKSAEKQPEKPPARTGRRVWQLGDFTEIRLAKAEAGAPANAHPINLSPEAIRALLGGIRTPVASGGDEPLFGVSELADLVESIHLALAASLPDEDVLMVSTSRRGGGLLTAPTSITARLFVSGDRLNVIVHDDRFEFFGLYRGAGTLPTFVFGSRTNPSLVNMRRAGATARRADWLEIPFSAVNTAIEVPGGASQPAATAAAPAAAATAAAPAAPAPAAAAAPAAAVTPVQPAAAPGRPRDAAFYDEQEQRLRTLKRLRDNNLISEDEYQQKRREVLQQL
jgi:Short C-terminal domain